MTWPPESPNPCTMMCRLCPRTPVGDLSGLNNKPGDDGFCCLYLTNKTWQIVHPIKKAGDTLMLFPTTIAGSLPKPEWLAEPNTLWAPWKSSGDALARAKRDATMLALKLQEDAGIDIVTEGEQSRQHFVHGLLANIEGIDFAHKVEMGIRKDRYKAMVPQVVAPLKLKGRVHADEARIARTHTSHQLKFTLPGPMTIIDTIADQHYGDRVKMAFAFAELLNEEARALQADGVDVIQFDEPAFNVYMDEVNDWGIRALDRAAEGLTCAKIGRAHV